MFLSTLHTKKRQQGSSLIVAVFLMVVFAILSLGVTQTISSSTDQNINEVLGTRALLAADAGNEKALLQLFPHNAQPSQCLANQQMYFESQGLLNCNVVSSCVEQTVAGYTYYQIISTGVCKADLQGSNASPVPSDVRCLAYEVCTSRTIEVEAKKRDE